VPHAPKNPGLLCCAGRARKGGCYVVGVDDEYLVTCPYCGEAVEIYVEPDVKGSFVQDCEVCCNPWRVRVTGRGENRDVHITRADGSE
jgi:Cysteine-rich CPXCG